MRNQREEKKPTNRRKRKSWEERRGRGKITGEGRWQGWGWGALTAADSRCALAAPPPGFSRSRVSQGATAHGTRAHRQCRAQKGWSACARRVKRQRSTRVVRSSHQSPENGGGVIMGACMGVGEGGKEERQNKTKTIKRQKNKNTNGKFIILTGGSMGGRRKISIN